MRRDLDVEPAAQDRGYPYRQQRIAAQCMEVAGGRDVGMTEQLLPDQRDFRRTRTDGLDGRDCRADSRFRRPLRDRGFRWCWDPMTDALERVGRQRHTAGLRLEVAPVENEALGPEAAHCRARCRVVVARQRREGSGRQRISCHSVTQGKTRECGAGTYFQKASVAGRQQGGHPVAEADWFSQVLDIVVWADRRVRLQPVAGQPADIGQVRRVQGDGGHDRAEIGQDRVHHTGVERV